MLLTPPALHELRAADRRAGRGALIALSFSILIHVALVVLFVLAQKLPTGADSISRGPQSATIWLSLSEKGARRAARDDTVGASTGEMAARPMVPVNEPDAPIAGERRPVSQVGPPVEQLGGAASATVPAEASLGLPDKVPDEQEGLDFPRRLLAHIRPYRRYPVDSGAARPTGVVRVGLVLERSGRVLRVWVVETSGYPVLDRAAVDTIWKAEPLPAIPRGLPDQINVVLPIDFSQQKSWSLTATPQP